METGNGQGATGSAVGEGEQADSASAVPRRLLAVATRLFAEQGFDRTSVQEIVTAAGVTKGALYHYFGSKDDLLSEIYGRVLREQTERLEKFAVTAAPLRERLASAASDVVVSSIANLDDTKIFMESMHQLAPEKQRAVRAERRRYHERFRGLIEEGQRTGEFRTDKPAEVIVDFFFGAVHHLAAWYRRDGELSAQQVGDHFADLLMSSLRPVS
ncbi:TetR/AcrR family transcriptional regulator [Amycolatopsis aidingensis]|uniref:TetR/AcrR family transcriptional regulator n=1 Tax=Amycolatopsis aidingensis TaxID=2842453 RepID=UPI001C0E277F|nr:TetR/AcrR family transcriptional regulator [Amycolatopsis aidingensis]